MTAQERRPRNVGWLVVMLVALGHCLAQDMQQRLWYPHLQEGSQQRQVQRDFYQRQVICSFCLPHLLPSFFLFLNELI